MLDCERKCNHRLPKRLQCKRPFIDWTKGCNIIITLIQKLILFPTQPKSDQEKQKIKIIKQKTEWKYTLKSVPYNTLQNYEKKSFQSALISLGLSFFSDHKKHQYHGNFGNKGSSLSFVSIMANENVSYVRSLVFISISGYLLVRAYTGLERVANKDIGYLLYLP